LVQDSTTISLPDALGWCFAGNYSRGKKKAVLKIQAIYDLLSNRFIHFEITPYTDNDQSKSNDILSIATKGDLVIRDLGYFVLKSFDGMRAQNISFISRLKFGVNIYPSTTSKKINLLQTIRSTGSFDQWVFLGSEQKVATRMVVLQMSQEQSDKRRRNAKQDRDKRLNHNQEYYDMLGYNVFITTEPASNLSAKQIAKLYGWRWRIESIFKCWKSHFNLQKIIPKNTSLTKERTEAIIHMMLIFILLLQVNLYNLVLKEAKKTSDKIISLIKLCQYIAHHFDCLLTQNLHVLMPEIIYYCCYDTRHDRLNYTQKMMLG
jgi:transposase